MTKLFGEKITGTIDYKGVAFELVEKDAAIYAGTLGYAADLESEPNIKGLLNRYSSLASVEKRGLTDPDFGGCISIDYWKNGTAPRGMMFMQQVTERVQDERYDVYETPASLFIRAKCDAESCNALFSRPGAEVWELFDVVKTVMAANGFEVNDNGAQEIELYSNDMSECYAYVPVKKKL